MVVVDRDPGPAPDGSWRRRGVMQFEHPHGFRHQVVDLLSAEWPEAWARWRALGAEPIDVPLPGVDTPSEVVGSRRSTYERALRAAAADVAGLTVEHGHVDALVDRDGARRRRGDRRRHAAGGPRRRRRRTALPAADACAGDRRRRHGHGVRDAQLPTPSAAPGRGPIDAPGRVGRDLRRLPGVRLRSRARALLGGHHPPDRRRRPSAAAPSRRVRRSLPGDPRRRRLDRPALAVPTSEVLVGVRLRNVYRPPLDRRGLVAIGDAVATTAPTAGRGVAMASMQIRALLELLDGGADPATDRRTVRCLVRRVDPPVGGGPRRHRRRSGAALAGRRHRPRPAVDLRGHRRRSPSRRADRPAHRPVPGHDRASQTRWRPPNRSPAPCTRPAGDRRGATDPAGTNSSGCSDGWTPLESPATGDQLGTADFGKPHVSGHFGRSPPARSEGVEPPTF